MAQMRDFSIFMRPRADGLAAMELAVEGVSCGGCIRRIETALKQVPGVAEARLNFTNRRLAVTWNPAKTGAGDLVETLERLGYGAHPFAARNAEDEDKRATRQLLRYLAVAGFAAMNIMLLSVSVWSGNVSDITPETRDFFHWLSALIALPAAAYAGQPFFRSAWTALRTLSVNMDVPISLGIVLALGLSVFETVNHAEHAYYDSAVMLLFFLLCGRYLDRAMRARTRAAAGNLAAYRAATAHKLDAKQQLIEMPATALKPGDLIVVRPGDRVPADGEVVDGSSEIDESLITGETAGKPVTAGVMVYAGSQNLSGALTLRVTAADQNTLLDEIERLLDKAVASRSRTVRLADWAARYYAPVVHTAAALTLAGWLLTGATLHDAMVVAISVLIITCPCALALAVPAVQVVAAGRLFRSGILINAGDAIERLAEVDAVVFDKTGTLTLPEPRVANATSVPRDLLQAAARLALSSRHPLAAALAREADDRHPFAGAVEQPGEGVRASVDGSEMRLGSRAFCGLPPAAPDEKSTASAIAFRLGDRHAVFQIRQALRPDAEHTIRVLRSLGLELRIMSGDRAEAVAPIAAALQITQWQGGLKPADKVQALEALRAEGRKVLMVGDGLNDAPSLAAAHVSISPITAADLSQAQADAVFLGAQLTPVSEAIVTTRFARRLMLQNLWLAAAYNTIAVPIAVLGLVTPLIAALAMSGSSLMVTANAMRGRLPGKTDTEETPATPPLVQARWSTP
jgi:P-type Cu2+ transporter